jgi:uncharacterized protein
VIYVDSSALLKLYVQEPHGDLVQSIVQQETNLFTSLITYAEIFSALARGLRDERLTPADYAHARSRFLTDWVDFQLVALNEAVMAPVERIIRSYALRGFDAIHLCSALWAHGPGFLSFDERLRQAARQEGLKVLP